MSRLIDADALSKKLLEELHNRSMQGFGKGLMIANSCVINAPTVEERKTGRWIGRPLAGYCTVRCSVCGDAFCDNDGRWNYCPNCGAKMEAEP